MPKGNGVRLALDRDLNGILDGDERRRWGRDDGDGRHALSAEDLDLVARLGATAVVSPQPPDH